MRRAWGWGDRCVVLYSGNLGLAHEFDTLLDAAEILRGERQLLFAFVGEGPRRDEVEREFARRGLTNVEFRPHVPRESLGDSLAAGDVHLVTMRDGIAGLVVPSKIYGILVAGVAPDGVGDEQRREREGRRARRLFDERFSRAAALSAHQALLESLAADPP